MENHVETVVEIIPIIVESRIEWGRVEGLLDDRKRKDDSRGRYDRLSSSRDSRLTSISYTCPAASWHEIKDEIDLQRDRFTFFLFSFSLSRSDRICSQRLIRSMLEKEKKKKWKIQSV